MKFTAEGEMPHDLDAEKAVLGAILLEPKSIGEVLPVVDAADFYHPAHRAIFEAMVELDRGSAPIDAVSMGAHLKATGTLEHLASVGGVEYLSSLLLEVVTTTTVAFHARSIARKAERRAWVLAAAKLLTTGLAGGLDDEFLQAAERDVLALTSKQRNDSGPVRVKQAMRDVVTAIEQRYSRRNDSALTGIPSGLQELDVFTLGWQPSTLVIVAARPSMGKTSLALCSAVEAAKAGFPVLFFSLEMDRQSLVERMIAMDAVIDSTALRTGNIDTKTWIRLGTSFSRIAEIPLWIDQESSLTIDDIRSRARRWAHSCVSNKTPLIVVDYVGLVVPGDRNKGNREREVAEVSYGLKALAKDLKCPVLALSQLNRGVEQRTNRRPMQADLRESGSLEQDADLVALLYRDDYYNDPPKFDQCKLCDAGVAEIIIAKQRNGPTGVAHVGWRAESTKFVNISRRDQ